MYRKKENSYSGIVWFLRVSVGVHLRENYVIYKMFCKMSCLKLKTNALKELVLKAYNFYELSFNKI